ncbi:spermidine/putrescine import ATP-binding protein PotA [Arthrobacter sp. Hiyo6]|nr:spermidine/putrescine import ATP-binding protein PotA [Arthrobacter sp. Hiyo6]
MIRFDKVRVSFDGFTAIPELSLEVEKGEFFTLLGPSGCGKTTALRTLAGFVDPEGGDVYVDGQKVTDLPSDRRQIGMVFQNYALFPSMNVRENIAFGLRVRRTGKAERERLVADIARRVDLTEDQLNKNVTELSGGQQQRVAIARAWCSSRRSCCWMNRYRTWTPNSASSCAGSSNSFSRRRHHHGLRHSRPGRSPDHE